MTDLQDLALADPIPAAAVSNGVVGGQAAIANISATTLILLADVILVLGETRTKVNTLFAELRTAGLLLP